MTIVKAAVIGHPIKHSKSPLIHNDWIARYGLEGSYEALDIPPADLAEALPRLIHEEGYAGFNLTIPHKELALGICEEVDDLARAVGAVNTVYVRDGKICGTNTDVYGFITNLKPFDFAAGKAVVLGAGGAARAVIYGLLAEGVPEIILTNRTAAKARELAKMDARIKVVDWDTRHEALAGANMLANTTALGMAGQPPLDIALDALPTDALVTDIVYAPLMTDLLGVAAARGNKIQTGIGMLLHQAAPAFEKWFGVMPIVDKALEEKVLAA